MQTGNEIISLQFGSFANYIAAHYFNIQDVGFSYNRDFIPDILPHCLFRASEDISTGDLISFTPRTVLVDDNFSVNHSIHPPNNDVENICHLPEGSVDSESIKLSSERKMNPFLTDLERSQSKNGKVRENSTVAPFFLFKSHYELENVTCWSDYLKTTLHRRSITLAPKESYLSSPRSLHHQGINCCNKEIAFWDQLEDNIRFFGEECDNLQGFQIICEGNSGFSGIATSVLHYLKDEYGKKVSIFVPAYFLPENTTNNQMQISTCNAVSCLAESKDSVDLIVPISLHTDPWSRRDQLTNRSLRNVSYKEYDKFQNSAVLAAGLELITSPYRMRGAESHISMFDYCRINTVGRCISVAGTIIPFPMTNTNFLNKVLKDWHGPFFDCISPICSLGSSNFHDIFYTFSKGVPFKSSLDQSEGSSIEKCSKDLAESLASFIQQFYFTRGVRTFFCKQNFRIPPTFPNIFHNTYNLTNPDLDEYGRISEFYGLGCLVNSKEVEQLLSRLHKRASESFPKVLTNAEESLNIDFNSALDSIATLASNYSETDRI